MRSVPWSFLAVLVALAQGAQAHSISDELGVGSTQTTPVNPRSGYIYDRLTGVVDVSEPVALRLDLTGTHDNATPPQQGARFGISGSNILAAALGVDWNPNEHLALSGEVDYSPKSSLASDAPVTFDGPTGSTSADALVKSSSGTYGFLAQVGYETAGESNLETMADGAFSVTHFSTVQNVAALATKAGAESIQKVIDYCIRTKAPGCRQYINAAKQEAAEFNQYKLSAAVTEVVHQLTELTLTGSYYLYDQDPTKVGYFSVATLGRSVAMGAGVPIAPLRFSVRPEVTHRFGDLRADLWYQYGKYVPGDGVSHAVGLKLQYKFSKAISAWISVDGQDDIDDAGNSTTSGTLAIGIKYRF